jgi:hypothetical protein
MRRRQVLSFFTAVFVANATSPVLLAGIPSKKAVYRGGTLSRPEPSTTGTVTTTAEDNFIFRYSGGEILVPYASINSMEYGQQAGRRLGLAIVLTPAFLLSKKRRHFLTINYVDANEKQQAAVFELGKSIVRTTLASIEARTGMKMAYQDEEARKASQR